MATKFSVDNEVGNPYTQLQNFITMRSGVFAPAPRRFPARSTEYKVTPLVFFVGGGSLLYSQDPCTDFAIYKSNEVVSRKDVPLRDPENKTLHFDPIPPTQFLANF